MEYIEAVLEVQVQEQAQVCIEVDQAQELELDMVVGLEQGMVEEQVQVCTIKNTIY